MLLSAQDNTRELTMHPDKKTDQHRIALLNAQLDDAITRADTYGILAIIFLVLWVATAGMAIYMVAAK
jgi:hypothetical protein